MSLIQLDSENAVEQIIEFANELPDDELEQLVSRLLMKNAERRQPHLSEEETRLMLTINRGLSSEERQRYLELHQKRVDETISPTEYQELLTLVERIETIQAERLGALIELAQIQKTTVKELMDRLQIKSPHYA